ncbi:4Fe-4S dicluster domain-containing protein [Pseudodesulfovibrio thermohalotolerans]|uniref:4Fe-4S dicluster domain-containing protein n=1 Tax=Pseudodesulfovibrio thermohalotolerans TaxID=2880651 RepID=UPI002442AD8D|nr:4Fe-4S dicluster domain-containing protein [Pseudodesulfovibrio thermohalotolerans]WFS62641.1 4Fe-4S dicluster domain-containing protein [Pseudodesulfovibrio thermohalotolerans]
MSTNKAMDHTATEEAADARPAVKKESSPCKGKGISRRKMLGFLGVQVVAGTLAGAAMAAPKNFKAEHYNRGITPDQLPNTRSWLITDPTTCVGCRTCEIVCSLGHDDICQPALSRIHTTYDPQHKLVKLAVMPDVCRQCNMADCYLACEYDALTLDPKTGARVIDPAKCQGCGECFAACPYDMIVENKEKSIFSKCDLCGGDPMCVKYCPADALKFIELG